MADDDSTRSRTPTRRLWAMLAWSLSVAMTAHAQVGALSMPASKPPSKIWGATPFFPGIAPILTLPPGEAGWMTGSAVLLIKSSERIQRRPEGELPLAPEFQKLPAEVRRPIGNPTAAERCRSAQEQLAAEGMTGSQFVLLPSKAALEKEYAEACLAPPESVMKFQSVLPRIGRLHSDTKVRCTVTLIDERRAITARHCIFDVLSVAGKMRARLLASAAKWKVQFGSLDAPQVRGIRAAWVPVDGTQWKRLQWNDSETQVSLQPVALPLDYTVVELDGHVQLKGPLLFASSSVDQGTELSLLGFYPGYKLSANAGDTGIRYQPVGLCKVLDKGPGQCVLHGCATNQGASGAPIFVQGDDGGVRLAAIHMGAVDMANVCSVPPGFNDVPNVAVQVRPSDIPAF